MSAELLCPDRDAKAGTAPDPELSPKLRNGSLIHPWALMDTQTGQGGSASGQATAEARPWFKDIERSLSPVLFCLDPEYAANAIQGTSQVHKGAVLIEKGTQL